MVWILIATFALIAIAIVCSIFYLRYTVFSHSNVGPTYSFSTTTDALVVLTPEQSAQKQAFLASLTASNVLTNLTPAQAKAKSDFINRLYEADK